MQDNKLNYMLNAGDLLRVTDVFADDSKFTPEHRLFCSILLKAVQEAVWKRVIITYIKQEKKEKKQFYSRCMNAVSYLQDTGRDDQTSVLALCDLFDIKYILIKNIIEQDPKEMINIENACFNFVWSNQLNGWRLVGNQRHQTYGCILRDCMFRVKI